MLGAAAVDTGSPPRFRWLLTRADEDDETQPSADYTPEVDGEFGATVRVTIKGAAPATYLLVVQQIGSAGGGGDADVVLAEKKLAVTCKYVRRELRDLSPADSEAFFRATGEYYSVSIDHGKAKYGDKFANSKIMAAYHHSAVRKKRHLLS